MIRIGGKPILEHNVNLMVRAGVSDIIVNLHHSPDVIRRYFGSGEAWGARIRYIYEPDLLGTAGAARNARREFGDEPFAVVYGDNLSTISLARMLEQHIDSGADLTMAVFERANVEASGIVAFDETGLVTRFLEKPSPDRVFSNWVNAGYYIASPSVFEYIPEAGPADFSRDVLPSLLHNRRTILAYRMTEPLWWIDTVSDYERTVREFSGRTMPNG